MSKFKWRLESNGGLKFRLNAVIAKVNSMIDGMVGGDVLAHDQKWMEQVEAVVICSPNWGECKSVL
jgi:hypothetical protein